MNETKTPADLPGGKLMQYNHPATIDDIPDAWEIYGRHGFYPSRSNPGEFVASEIDDFVPTYPIVFFVPVEGGEVRADVFGEAVTDAGGNLLNDPWTYDVPTGIFLTGEEVEGMLA